MENLIGGFISGLIYYTFCGQPLTIIAPTGTMIVFESIAFHLASMLGLDFLTFRLWYIICGHFPTARIRILVLVQLCISIALAVAVCD